MKRLRYMRHARYDKKTGGLCRGELDLARETVPKEKYTDIIYSPTYRTTQTALAAVAGLDFEVQVHEPLDEMKDGPHDLDTLEKIFNLIPEYGFGLAIGHAEQIEAIAAFSLDFKVCLHYLDYIDFIQNKDGEIMIARP